ncbi:hypothetical protein AGMMS49992_26170 [Clostridia bacterium]|nr:hypothetical protein AGMMS49992_26170 [Clostridia bacterium]
MPPMNPFRNRSYLTLYMTFVMVLVTPLIILLVSFNTSVHSTVMQDYLALNSQIVSSIRNTLDTYISARTDFAYTLSGNMSLKKLAARIDDTPEERHQACMEIYNFCRAIQSFDNIFTLTAVYLPDRDLVISSRNVQMNADAFLDNYVGFADMDREAFNNLVRSTNLYHYYPTAFSQTRMGVTRWLILYVLPVSQGYLKHRAYFLSLIDQESFRRLFTRNFDTDIHFRLLDNSGVELMSSDGFPDAWRESAPLGETDWVVQNGQERYHAFFSSGSVSGLQYVFFIPELHVLKQLTAFQRIWLIVTLLCLGFGLIITRQIANRLYQPIQELLRQTFPEGLPTGTRSIRQEVGMVEARMRETQSINRQFQQTLDQYYKTTRDTVLMKLLTQSRQLTQEALIEAADICALPTLSQCYYVIFIDCGDQPDHMHSIVDSLTQWQKGESDAIMLFAELAAAQTVIVLSAPDQLTAQAALDGFITDFHSVRVGLSQPHNSIRMLQRCLSEATTACMRHIPGTVPYLSYGESTANATALYYPVEKEIQIIAASRSGAYDEVRQLLLDLNEANTREHGCANETQMFLYNNLITTAIKAYDPIQDEHYELYESCLRLLSSLSQRHEPADRIIEEIQSLYRDLCTNAQVRTHSKNRNIMENVLAYLEQNHADPALCLDMVSDHFRVSYYFLSRIFKEETNQSFSDLLNDIRIKHAIQLLNTANEGNPFIATQVGYSNVSTFLRAFKKRTGITPQQYRRK